MGLLTSLSGGGSSGVSVPDAVSGRKIIFAGDSFTEQNTGTSAASGSAYHRSDGYAVQFLARTGWPYYWPVGMDPAIDEPVGYNAGVGGDTSALLLARYQTDVINKLPNIVSIFIGTNDVRGGDSTTAAAYITNINAMIAMNRTIGAETWLHTIPPRNTDGTGLVDFTANERLIRSDCNNRLRDLKQYSDIVIIEHDGQCDPATGSAKAGTTREGLHPTTQTAWQYADDMITALGMNLPPPMVGFFNDKYNIYNATYNPNGNLLANPILAGTGGTASTGVTGSIADDCIAARSTGSTITAVGSKVTRTVNGALLTGQRFVVTSDGSGASGEIIRLRQGASGSVGATRITAGVSTGKWLVPGFLCVTYPTQIAQNIQGIYADVIDGSTNGRASRGIYIGHALAGYWPNVKQEYFVECPPVKLVGTTGFFFDLDIRVDGSVANVATVDLFAPNVITPYTAPPITAY